MTALSSEIQDDRSIAHTEPWKRVPPAACSPVRRRHGQTSCPGATQRFSVVTADRTAPFCRLALCPQDVDLHLAVEWGPFGDLPYPKSAEVHDGSGTLFGDDSVVPGVGAAVASAAPAADVPPGGSAAVVPIDWSRFAKPVKFGKDYQAPAPFWRLPLDTTWHGFPGSSAKIRPRHRIR